MEAKLRRQQSILFISGIAFIALGAWSIVKTFMVFLIDPSELVQHILERVDSAELHSTDPVNFFIAILIMLTIELVLRVFVGLSAISESRGKNRIGYVVIALFLTAGNIMSTARLVIEFGDPTTLLDNIVPGIIDLTTMVAIADMSIAAIRVKLLRRKIRRLKEVG